MNGFASRHNLQIQNNFLSLESDDDEFNDSDAAPTPMLGGG